MWYGYGKRDQKYKQIVNDNHHGNLLELWFFLHNIKNSADISITQSFLQYFIEVIHMEFA